MQKIFNTKLVDEFEILDIIVGYLDDTDIHGLIESNVALKFHFKPINGKRKKLDREITDKKIKQQYRQDITLKREIVNRWNFDIVKFESEMMKNKYSDEYIDSIVEEQCTEELFVNSTILWKNSEPKIKKKGDDLYKEYKKSLNYEDIESEEKDSDNKVDDKSNSNAMNVSIGEFITKVCNVNEELENTKKELESKIKENNKLKESLDTVLDNRDLRKEIKALNKRLQDNQTSSESINKSLLNEIKELKKQNEELKTGIESIIKSFNKIQIDSLSKDIIKNISETQTNMNNSLKGGIVEAINKNVDNRLKSIEDRIETIANVIKIKEKTVVEEIPELSIDEPIDDSLKGDEINDSNGLAQILKGLGSSL